MKAKLTLLIAGLALIGLAACQKEKLPLANFTTQATKLAVQFTNNSSNAHSSYWTFGDGSVSDQTSPSHTYTSAGTYSVQLRVLNKDLQPSFVTQSITVTP